MRRGSCCTASSQLPRRRKWQASRCCITFSQLYLCDSESATLHIHIHFFGPHPVSFRTDASGKRAGAASHSVNYTSVTAKAQLSISIFFFFVCYLVFPLQWSNKEFRGYQAPINRTVPGSRRQPPISRRILP